ncbi:MAG TPA: Ppx/GppA phosphatase family protein [Pyrinomonadaceae bacterium]|nr:Ppx/GppA phosphatase family protein [Pyrinomonadaceae bacterium]
MKIAAIDIGSNSIKLVVVEAASSDSFAVLAREKEVVRLGHDTLREGHLSPAAISRAAACIGRFRAIAEARGAEQLVTIATASVREAHNSAEFIDEVQKQTGLRVEVLSGVEEARLIGLAAARGCGAGSTGQLNIDIGGGSTEFSLVIEGLPAELFSVKLGAVGLTEQLIANDPVKPKELRALREEIRSALERPARELRGRIWQLVTGTSGTIIAIGEALRLRRLRSVLPGEQSAQPAGAEIKLAELERFNERMAVMDLKGRSSVPGVTAQRAEIIVAGGQILEGAMRALGINALRTCDWALREGAIINRLREMEAESRPPVPDTFDPQLLGVHAVGRRFGYEEAHAHQTAALAEKIFDQLAGHYKLSRHQRTLLSAAALLHDVGYHIAHDAHHRHSLYLIKHSELTGFSEAEREVIANVARYHRRALPKERHPDYAALGYQDRETVWRLGGILRLADALDRGHDNSVSDLVAERSGREIHLEIVSAHGCEKEIWAAQQKRDMFEAAFNCKLFISRRALARRA